MVLIALNRRRHPTESEALHRIGCGRTGVVTDARAAGRGTTWLNTLVAPADSSAAPEQPDLDPLDEQAMTGMLANAARLAKPTVFDAMTQRAPRRPAGQTPRPYEAALVVLGQLAGAVPSEGDGNNDAAPDAIWIFGTNFDGLRLPGCLIGAGVQLAHDQRDHHAEHHGRRRAVRRASHGTGASMSLILVCTGWGRRSCCQPLRPGHGAVSRCQQSLRSAGRRSWQNAFTFTESGVR